jgi:hypothetical protein
MASSSTGYIVAIALIAVACVAAIARILWLHFHEDRAEPIESEAYDQTAQSETTKETTTTNDEASKETPNTEDTPEQME